MGSSRILRLLLLGSVRIVVLGSRLRGVRMRRVVTSLLVLRSGRRVSIGDLKIPKGISSTYNNPVVPRHYTFCYPLYRIHAFNFLILNLPNPPPFPIPSHPPPPPPSSQEKATHPPNPHASTASTNPAIAIPHPTLWLNSFLSNFPSPAPTRIHAAAARRLISRRMPMTRRIRGREREYVRWSVGGWGDCGLRLAQDIHV